MRRSVARIRNCVTSLAVGALLTGALSGPARRQRRRRAGGRPDESGQPVHRHPELRQHLPRRERAVRHGPGQPGHRRPGRLRLPAEHDPRLQPDPPVRRRLRRRGRAADHADDRRGRLRRPERLPLDVSHDDEQAAARLLPGRPVDVRHRRRADRHRSAPAGSATPSPPTGAANVLFNTGQGQPDGATTPRSTSSATGPSRAGCSAGGFCAGQGRAHRLLHGHVRPAVRVLRHVARQRLPRPAAGTRPAAAATAPGSRFDATTDRDVVRQGRPVLHRSRRARGRTSRRRPRTPSTSTPPRAARTTTWKRAARRDQDRRRHHATGSAPSTPRSTTRCCTRTWPATSTAGTRASTARCTPRTGYTPYQNFSLWDTYRPQNQLLAAARTAGRPRRRAVGGRDRPGRRLAAALGAGQHRDQHHDRRPGDAVPGRGLVEGPARRARAGGLRAAAQERHQHAAGRLAVQRPLGRGLLPRARLHPVRARLGRTAPTRAATTTASTRRRRRWSTRPPTRRWR